MVGDDSGSVGLQFRTQQNTWSPATSSPNAQGEHAVKSLHQPDLFAWSIFDCARNVDFNGTFWKRDEANVVIDPMPLSDHDEAHADTLGGIGWILLTNADHVRDAAAIAHRFGARIAAPEAERLDPRILDLDVDHWMVPGEILSCGIECIGLDGSKGLAGEMAFLLPGGDTLVCGDLIRGQRAGSLNLLPDPKLSDRKAAIASVQRLLDLPQLNAILVGDGQSVFRDATERLRDMLAGEA